MVEECAWAWARFLYHRASRAPRAGIAGFALALLPLTAPGADVLAPAARSAGDFTAPFLGQGAYAAPAQVLTAPQIAQFALGREAFAQRWVVAPAIGGPWGLGPTFNGDRCTSCHEGNGRGQLAQKPGARSRAALVRVSIPGTTEFGAPKPVPAYGDQLNDLGVEGRAPAEGEVSVEFHEIEVELRGGEKVRLRRPELRIDAVRFGVLPADAMLSLRVAPAVFGLGLLEAVPEESIHAIARAQAGGLVSGRANSVWDFERGKRVLGRFGWKANQPTLRQQVAAAFHGDIGVTSEIFPHENCPEIQQECRATPPGGYPEVTTKTLAAIEFYLRALAVPARRNQDDAQVKRGEELFLAAQCALCHVPTLETGAYPALPAAEKQTIHPYTDMLLHDMGAELADGRPDFEADGREWRTAPLWGLGLAREVSGEVNLLHDGRARDVTEAILWHGGEAQAAREAFRALAKDEREALVRFVESL